MPNGTVQHRKSFEQFNPFVPRAKEDAGESYEVWAMLAIAFEISQMRYQLTRLIERLPNGR